jgi:hypothetical protein
LPQKVYLNTNALKPNFQKLLKEFNMVVIGEISEIEDVEAEEDIDELDVEEGEVYTEITIRAIKNLGYSKDNVFNICAFPDIEDGISP